MATVPVVVLDHLTPAQKRAYVLADNKLALNAGWDDAVLVGELQALQTEDFDLSLLGWSVDELAELMPEAEELPPEDADADAVPEPPAEPVTKPGDVWLLGKHRVMCGDSTDVVAVERLMAGGKADLLLTDPPYGINISANPVRQKHQKKDWDAKPIDDQTLSFFNSITTFAIIWGGNYFGLPPAQCFYVWDKKQPEEFSLAMCEIAWTNIPGPAKMFRMSVTSYRKEHPTQKPVELLEWCLSKADGDVLDPFGGSGSTLIACEKTSRQARLMELDPCYCDVIVRRWQQFTGKTATLESTGEPFPAET
jgi:16S rRNA G966 N2-methylase RsmD